jgi:pheromone shutdown protein TraB
LADHVAFLKRRGPAPAGTPPFALAFALLGTRRFLGRHLERGDLPAAMDGQVQQAMPEFTRLIGDRRDALLVECLVSLHQARRAEKIDVAVVYGAGHMPAVCRELLRRCGYRPRRALWLTVFDF